MGRLLLVPISRCVLLLLFPPSPRAYAESSVVVLVSVEYADQELFVTTPHA